MQVSEIIGGNGEEMVTISPSAPFVDAARLIRQSNIGIVVVCKESGFLAGVVSERDVVRIVAEHADSILELAVEDVFTEDVVTYAPEDDTYEVMSVMDHWGTRHIPVVKFGRLVGLLSSRDILRSRLRRFEADDGADHREDDGHEPGYREEESAEPNENGYPEAIPSARPQ